MSRTEARGAARSVVLRSQEPGLSPAGPDCCRRSAPSRPLHTGDKGPQPFLLSKDSRGRTHRTEPAIRGRLQGAQRVSSLCPWDLPGLHPKDMLLPGAAHGHLTPSRVAREDMGVSRPPLYAPARPVSHLPLQRAETGLGNLVRFPIVPVLGPGLNHTAGTHTWRVHLLLVFMNLVFLV